MTHKVVLIDQNIQAKSKIGESLPPACQRILKNLKIYDDFIHENHLTNPGFHSYWGSDRVQYVDHIFNPDGLGWFIDRKAFESFFRKKVIQGNIHCLWDQKFLHAKTQEGQWNITTSSKNNISAPFIIDAGGRASPFTRSIKIERQSFDKLISCWACITNNNHKAYGHVIADKNGWWYSVPIPNQRRIIAFQTDSDLMDDSLKKKPNALIEYSRLSPQMSKLLDVLNGEITIHESGIVPANSTRLRQFCDANWAAIGDSSLSFDPLSSQGIFHAMASGMQLSELIQSNQPIHIKYQQQMEGVWQQYLNHKKNYYNMESRWIDSPFWQRRSEI